MRFDFGCLLLHRGTKAAKRGHEPISTGTMRSCAGDARAKVHLTLHEGVSRVGREEIGLHRFGLFSPIALGFTCVIAVAGRECSSQ